MGVGVTLQNRTALSPSDAHYHIKLFLGDHYQFHNVAQMKVFVEILASANDKNTAWVRSTFSHSDDVAFSHLALDL